MGKSTNGYNNMAEGNFIKPIYRLLAGQQQQNKPSKQG